MSFSSRLSALRILNRIIHASTKASVALDDAGIPASERALVYEMVYGVLRRWYSLEADMSRFCKAKPDAWAHLALLLGTYQIRHMRIPVHAAVSETIEALKKEHPKATGYVNAVLRKVAMHEPPGKIKPYQQAELPRWMYALWRDAFGAEAVLEFSAALQQTPPLCLAVLRQRNQWMRQAAEQGVHSEKGELSPHAVLLNSAVNVVDLPGYSQGEFMVMDQSAQAAVMAVDAVPDGSVILDLCASPGGKTALLSHRFPNTHIMAVELASRRLPRLQENMARIGCRNVSLLHADAGKLPYADHSVDAVLLDAPCTASGVLRRHPDAKFLHTDHELEAIAQQQRTLALEALRVLKPGAQLLYAVCSIHPAENEQVMETLAGNDARLQELRRLLPTEVSDGFFFASLYKQ